MGQGLSYEIGVPNDSVELRSICADKDTMSVSLPHAEVNHTCISARYCGNAQSETCIIHTEFASTINSTFAIWTSDVRERPRDEKTAIAASNCMTLLDVLC